jgi:phage pi2 protein 07
MTTKTWWNMQDLINESNESRKWIMDNLIKNDVIWSEIEPFSYKAKHNNDEYRFVGPEMQDYLIENFKRLKEG